MYQVRILLIRDLWTIIFNNKKPMIEISPQIKNEIIPEQRW